MENCCSSGKMKMRTEEEKKTIVSRLNRIAGQVNGIARMVEEDRYCDDILIQLSAVEKSVKSLSALIFEGHVHTCLIENIQSGNLSVVDEIVDLFKRFQ